MFQNNIYYAGEQDSDKKLFLLEIINSENNFSNYIYAYVKAIHKDDKYIIMNIEFINNIFNSLYSLNVNNLEKIDGELYKNILSSIIEFLLKDNNNLNMNKKIYNMLMYNFELKENNDVENESSIKNDVYTVNKIKALDLISEMEDRK